MTDEDDRPWLTQIADVLAKMRENVPLTASDADIIVQALEDAHKQALAIQTRERLEEIVGWLFPSDRHPNQRATTTDSVARWPDRPEGAEFSWWNAAGLVEYREVFDPVTPSVSGYQVTVQSYVGDSRYDTGTLFIPKDWIALDESSARKVLVQSACWRRVADKAAESARRAVAKNQAEVDRLERELTAARARAQGQG